MAEETEAVPISFTRQLAALDVGDSVAVAKRIQPCSEAARDIASVKSKLRQSVNPRVSRARTKHGHDYIADCGEYVTTDGHIVVTIAVTRTE